jgi:hypothetical protein
MLGKLGGKNLHNPAVPQGFLGLNADAKSGAKSGHANDR